VAAALQASGLPPGRLELEITEKTKTNKQLAKAFSKFASKKVVNRVLLRQFIEKVAGMSTRKVA
jgi:EAL domain-containing protein (putative c-di-GMP-specific phosphodiesterase class I)